MIKKAEWDKKIQSYQRMFAKYGANPKALRWKDQGSIQRRFTAIARELNLPWKTVLDVGCGYGDMYEYLIGKFKGIKYTGIDMVKEFVDVAKKRFPDANVKFECRNFFETPGDEKYDVVICSGVLNSAFENPDEFRKKAIKELFNIANKVLVFNIAGAYPQPVNKKGSSIYYSDALDILRYCCSLTSRVVYNHAYSSRDFTVAMYK